MLSSVHAAWRLQRGSSMRACPTRDADVELQLLQGERLEMLSVLLDGNCAAARLQANADDSLHHFQTTTGLLRQLHRWWFPSFWGHSCERDQLIELYACPLSEHRLEEGKPCSGDMY